MAVIRAVLGIICFKNEQTLPYLFGYKIGGLPPKQPQNPQLSFKRGLNIRGCCGKGKAHLTAQLRNTDLASWGVVGWCDGPG